MKIHDLQVWEAFYGVAKHGNFSKASKVLGIPVPQISKRVAKLEDQLGVRLFQRSTRSVTLTNEGKSLIPKLSVLLEDFESLENNFEKETKISGSIKITSVPYVAHKLLLPHLAAFKKLHPEINLEINLTTNFINIIEQGYDLAFRIETPKDSELIYKKLRPNDLCLCATPKYLKKYGTPKKRADLKNHEMLVLEIHKNCTFKSDNNRIKEFIKKESMKSDNANFLKDLCLNHHGILLRAKSDVKEELTKGKLIEVLTKDNLETFGDIYAVIPSRRYLASRVRVFLDFIAERVK